MDLTVENLVGLLIRSRLLTPENAKGAYQRWQAEGRDIGNINLFARWLVNKQLVTEYQASLLLKGRADDFFLNQYQIQDRLGRGRMAGVYRAVHSLGQVVAIKVLPPSKAKDPQLLARFQREARLALKLKHPNVVRSFQVGESRGLHYLVMEHLEGETLDEVLQRRKKMPPQEAVRLIHQALLGLQHIHEMGMVHRDLKPANLMLVPASLRGEPDSTLRATVKVLDIGLGREFFDEGQATGDPNQEELTREGVILGTPDYLAPEQARDARSIDIRADIYSLGCVLYHLLTGQPPFPDKNLINQMIRHANENPKPLKDFNPQIPDGLQQILNWMMAKQPGQRYPTPERAAQALQVFLLAETESTRGEEPAPMKKYLTWLETSQPLAGPEPETLPPTPAPAFPVPAARPAALAVAPVPGTVPAKGPVASPVPIKSGIPVGIPVQPPTPKNLPAAPKKLSAKAVLREEDVDVELVPVDDEETDGLLVRLLARLGLSRRDWILLSIGGGFMVIMALVAGGVVLWLRGGGQ